MAVDKSVAISAARWFIVLCKCKETIRTWGLWLRRVVTKQLRSVIYGAVAIAIQCKLMARPEMNAFDIVPSLDELGIGQKLLTLNCNLEPQSRSKKFPRTGEVDASVIF